MSLTKVSLRDGSDWKITDADKAAAYYPEGVRAGQRLFRCDYCGQYVLLAVGNKNRPHFRHSSSEEDKNCEERTFYYGYSGGKYSAVPRKYSKKERISRHSLSLKIKLDGKTVSFEIGFPILPNAEISKISNNDYIVIESRNTNNTPFKYKIIERLNTSSVDYLFVGNVPAEEYLIQNSPNKMVHFSKWPEVVEGVCDSGNLFDVKSGKRIALYSEIEAGRKYYFLTLLSISVRNNSFSDDLNIKELLQIESPRGRWHIYEIDVEEYTQSNSYFFKRYGYILLPKSIDLTPLWPPSVEKDNVISRNGGNLYLFLGCQAEVCSFPYTNIEGIDADKGRLLKIPESSDSLNISVVHNNQETGEYDKYYTLETNKNYFSGKFKSLEIKDFRDTLIEAGTHSELPQKNIIKIFSLADAVFTVTNNGIAVKSIQLKSEKNYTFEQFKFGDEIRIYQGMDCVWKAFFQKENKKINDDIDAFLMKLEHSSGRKLKINHTFGNFYKFFDNSEIMCQWFYKIIRQGWIKENALKLLRIYCLNKFKNNIIHE